MGMFDYVRFESDIFQEDAIFINPKYRDEWFQVCDHIDWIRIDWFNRKIKVRENGLESIRPKKEPYFRSNATEEDKIIILNYLEKVNKGRTPPLIETCSRMDCDAMPMSDLIHPYGTHIKYEYLPSCFCEGNNDDNWGFCEKCGGSGHGISIDNYATNKYGRLVMAVLHQINTEYVQDEKLREKLRKDMGPFCLPTKMLIKEIAEKLLDWDKIEKNMGY